MNCKPIGIKDFTPANGFVLNLQRLIKQEVIPYQYAVLRDEAEGAEKSHVVKNFENCAKALRGEDVGDGFYGMVFQDSDAAKWLEAAAYSLALFPDKELEKHADELIELIASAQDKDGYLNTYFTIKDKDKRWTDLLEGHELYCAGHFMEAAAAYFEATGKDTLLKVMERCTEHIYNRFITEKNEGYPGHPEVELALLKMYESTGEKKYTELAKHFIDSRGADGNFFKREAERRDWTVWGNNAEDGYYQQSYASVREQRDAVGHSVRAVYLYTGMAGIADLTEDKELLEACRVLWKSITERRMYVTGGIGSTCIGEAFTADFDLPNDTAYAETCASCGLMFFARAMLKNELNGEYADVMERAFYNTVLAGMSLDGKRFFYVNPLEIIPGISGAAATHWHTKPQRPEWFTCACCPPNLARTVSSLGTYAYGTAGDVCCCHLFAAGDVDFGNGLKLRCSTEFPYGFTVKYEILSGGGKLAVRVPAWSESFSAIMDGAAAQFRIENGYAFFDVHSGGVLEIKLDDTPRLVYCSSKVSENTGCAAVTRGALVYCFEGVDNHGDVLSLSLGENSKIEIGEHIDELGVRSLKINGFRTLPTTSLYTSKKPEAVPQTLIAVPYYTWGNRGENQMRVWIPTR